VRSNVAGGPVHTDVASLLARPVGSRAPPSPRRASRTGHHRFRTLTQSGRTGVVLERGARTILWGAEGRATRLPFPRPNPKRLPERKVVTIVAGFKFQEGVVICADTQETVGNVIKRQAPKLRFEPSLQRIPGQLPTKTGIAVAFCGATNNGAFVDKVIDLAWEKAKTASDLEGHTSRIWFSLSDGIHARRGTNFRY
jgi:hypothetical protein